MGKIQGRHSGWRKGPKSCVIKRDCGCLWAALTPHLFCILIVLLLKALFGGVVMYLLKVFKLMIDLINVNIFFPILFLVLQIKEIKKRKKKLISLWFSKGNI